MAEQQIIEWGEYDEKALEEEQRQLQREDYKIPVGKNYYRFLPPPKGFTSPFVIVHKHFFRINGKVVTFACPRHHGGRTCGGCKRAEELRATGNVSDRELAEEFMPRAEIYANVIDRKHEAAGPKTKRLTPTVKKKLDFFMESKSHGNYTHPVTGYDILIQRTGESKENTEYEVVASRNNSELGQLGWILAQKDLRVLLQPPTDDEIRHMLSGDRSTGRDRAPESRQVVQGQTAPAEKRATDVIDTTYEDGF
jgi:hypothetical protein